MGFHETILVDARTNEIDDVLTDASGAIAETDYVVNSANDQYGD